MFFTCYFTGVAAAAALLGSSPSSAASNDLPLALLRLLATRPSSLARADANATPHRPSFVALLQAACCLDTHKIAAAATFLRLNCNCCLHLVVGPRPS